MTGFYYLIWKHPIIHLETKCTSAHPPVAGSLFLHRHQSLEWREAVGAGSGQSCCGTHPAQELLITETKYSKQ